MSYAADTNKILSGSNLISNKTSLKPRGEKKLQGISGKHIIINTAAQSVQNNYYDVEKQGAAAASQPTDSSPYYPPISNEKSSNQDSNSKVRDREDNAQNYQH